ncbi:hypothetical protein A1O3_07343 [Capronia epimyces CBS 606.96]|uniref:Ketoreductase (KR) domain-containing protein n=1 Tax=Capronia epimyces CBS 606.96 TaxID=1182542 RepID=W9XUN4_9EURO|nr:uncharacterized protein A1O3_07343 [Capronia epimyces CBS 606.96]EXJ81055.1 hypothetical protein A1O3_07343 [Capronia epimyces CBS 606.96]
MAVALSDVVASNQRIDSTFPHGLVAVFVGATSGIGEYTLKALAKYATKPRAYIVGRSQDAADRIIRECKQSNPSGTFEFIKADVSVLKTVDDVCRQIKSKETAINILFESQGTMAFDKKTSDGLPLASALILHSRMRFILNLLPLLQNAQSLRRVVSVGAATCEGPIDMDNMLAQNVPLMQWRNQIASIETLLLEEAMRRAPDVSFIHDVPGVVKSGIQREAKGLRMTILIAISRLLAPLIETPPLESGERHLFLATSARYPPGRNEAAVAGVSLHRSLVLARGTLGREGSGVYSLGAKCESAPAKVETLLAEFRESGTAQKVWDSVADDFKKITGTEVAP